jgi:hypothetical protein
MQGDFYLRFTTECFGFMFVIFHVRSLLTACLIHRRQFLEQYFEIDQRPHTRYSSIPMFHMHGHTVIRPYTTPASEE